MIDIKGIDRMLDIITDDAFDYTYYYREELDKANTLTKIRCEMGDHDWKYHFRELNAIVERCGYMCGVIRKRGTFYYRVPESDTRIWKKNWGLTK